MLLGVILGLLGGGIATFAIQKVMLKSKSEKLIKLFLKAMIAQDLWGTTEFYRIYNERNDILQAALKTLKNGSYEKAGLE